MAINEEVRKKGRRATYIAIREALNYMENQGEYVNDEDLLQTYHIVRAAIKAAHEREAQHIKELLEGYENL